MHGLNDVHGNAAYIPIFVQESALRFFLKRNWQGMFEISTVLKSVIILAFHCRNKSSCTSLISNFTFNRSVMLLKVKMV